MNSNDTIIVDVLKTTVDDQGEYDEKIQVMVKGLSELSHLLNLIDKSRCYSFLGMTNIGYVDSIQDLFTDLIEDQKPEGMSWN